MKKAIKIVLTVLLVLLIAVIVTVNIFMNGIIKKGVETIGPRALGVPVTLDAVSVRFLRGKVVLKDFVVGNPAGFKSDSLFAIKGLKVNLDTGSLLGDTIVIKEIMIDKPDITYEVGLKGSNIGELMKNLQADKQSQPEKQAEEKSTEKSEKKVIIEKLVIKNGVIGLKTPVLAGHGVSMPLPTITMTDIGKEKDGSGASLPMVISEVMNAVLKTVTGVVASSGKLAGKSLKEATNIANKGLGAAAGAAGKVFSDGGKAVGDEASKVVDDIGGIFKKRHNKKNQD